MFVTHKQRIPFRGLTVCLSLSMPFFFFLLHPLPSSPHFICPVLSSFLPSILIRMGHVQVGRGRRLCPSAAVCQRRRSAVLLTAFTPWWVSHSDCLRRSFWYMHIKYFMWKVNIKGFKGRSDWALWDLFFQLFKAKTYTKSQRMTTWFISWIQVEGSELKKIRTNSRVYQRYYLLDTGLQALCWEPSKKESDKARIFLASIREVSIQTKKF